MRTMKASPGNKGDCGNGPIGLSPPYPINVPMQLDHADIEEFKMLHEAINIELILNENTSNDLEDASWYRLFEIVNCDSSKYDV